MCLWCNNLDVIYLNGGEEGIVIKNLKLINIPPRPPSRPIPMTE